MTDQELRALVRDAIARKVGSASGQQSIATVASMREHASHGLFVLPAGQDADGPCIIEPTVRCNHCGYCKSYGH